MRASRVLMGCAAVPVFVVLVVASLLAFASLERRTEITLPTPTGAFAVGRAIHDWIDAATMDTLAPVAGTKRELLVWIWYPTDAAPGAPVDSYFPSTLKPKDSIPAGSSLFGLLTRDGSKVHGHSIRDAVVSPRQPSYPVVIMRGGASAEVYNYSTLAEDLASHGYVVVGFDAPYRTGLVIFPDGRVRTRRPENNPEVCLVPDRAKQEQCVGRILAAWTGDISFVLDRLARLTAFDSSARLTGRLDMTHVGVFGHSLGGAAAAQFCHDDSRCKAAIDIDGAPHGSVVHDGLRQPFMFLLSDHGNASDPESRQIEADIGSIYDKLPSTARVIATIRGAHHFTFSDDGALLKSRVLRGVMRVLGKLGIAGRRQLEVTTYAIHTFFDAYLKGTGTPAIASPQFPEIVVRP